LTNLEYLSLNNNKIQTLSQNITALTKLKHLILSNNNFRGTIPAELADLELITLHLDNNYFSGIIPDAILNKIVDGSAFKVCPQKFGFPSYFDNHPCD
jgi:Leucine-rich repeat (LRR) protein